MRSLSFFDAQGSGLPVIAEGINANRVRITPERQDGFHYQVDDWKDLRQRIAERMSMGPENRFSCDSIATRMEEIMCMTRQRWLSHRKIGGVDWE